MTSSINLKARAMLESFPKMAKSLTQKASREMLVEVGRRLIDRSPVGNPATWHPAKWPKGYVPGHFINNWQLGIDRPVSGIIPGVDPSGVASIERLKKLGRWTIGHTYYLTNNLPYAKRLENGWSKQAPRGMVGLTRLEIPAIAKIVAARIRSEGLNVDSKD